MKALWIALLYSVVMTALAAPQFHPASPSTNSSYQFNTHDLCSTAKSTLAYLNKGTSYDPKVIHSGQIVPIPLYRIKATLEFICQHQAQLNDPYFVKTHFDFIRWYPDRVQAQTLAKNKSLVNHLPKDKILMTKYYVHLAKASKKPEGNKVYAIYGLPRDEQQLTLEEANTKPYLTRFRYGKQAILKGILAPQDVPILAYVSRADLESALLQGTVVADFGAAGQQIFNVHRCNNIAYDRQKSPYEQERYWYFKAVDGIKGYGKDADHKITVNTKTTFAGDLSQFGLGNVLLIQYQEPNGKRVTQMGIMADTGGAFDNNLYQVDYLAGSYAGTAAFSAATKNLPDYVDAYFMVLKKQYVTRM